MLPSAWSLGARLVLGIVVQGDGARMVAGGGGEREMDNHLRMAGKGKSGVCLHNST